MDMKLPNLLFLGIRTNSVSRNRNGRPGHAHVGMHAPLERRWTGYVARKCQLSTLELHLPRRAQLRAAIGDVLHLVKRLPRGPRLVRDHAAQELGLHRRPMPRILEMHQPPLEELQQPVAPGGRRVTAEGLGVGKIEAKRNLDFPGPPGLRPEGTGRTVQL
ncbi:unnamed protein product [Bursaphelenchus xylophilus]|uniref:(pine wood nematode) hypothetical protein n=1 Tax=Bursaphelenchus xylophilus TaxID=6326 RepID=A0A7I8XMJ7_BURXY|nr:unnamed protein product [Bursaphelenchus xylophilus]CAG9089234.1 unnamed protein product [Bursaphelenchus xylophilus]